MHDFDTVLCTFMIRLQWW